MKYATGADFRRALEMRLRTLTQRDHTPLVRLRKFVAFERLLARLLHNEPDAWVLKGGLALQLRLGQHARTTKDMDLMWRHSAADLHQLLNNAVTLDLNDWFRFIVEQPKSEEEPLPGGGRRFYMHTQLDSRPFEVFHVDVGINDPMIEPVQLLQMPALLDFADIPPTVAPCFPITQQLAEKVHAYTRPHASGASTRVKDLIDILLLAGLQPILGLPLHQALRATFPARNTHPQPMNLPDPPKDWRQPFQRMADETGLPWHDLSDAVAPVQQFVDPVLQSSNVGNWNPLTWKWEYYSF